MKAFYCLLVCILISFTGCASDDFLYDNGFIVVNPNTNSSNRILSEGQLNAVKKARQMTDLSFTPMDTLDAKNKIYLPNRKYTGLIYSSVKELDTYVGSNISFHTFMTAVNNPRSVIYKKQIDEKPYHGVNCRAYYGTVCSGLVSYALGLYYATYDFPDSDIMQEINHTTPENLEIADVLWKPGHVMLITDVQKDNQGIVQNIEICESNHGGARRYTLDRSDFIDKTGYLFTKVYRYTELDKNVSYTPALEFVPVLGEEPKPFTYNDDLCVDKGDKSCYLEGEPVTINVFHNYKYLEIYKNNSLYRKIEFSEEYDVVLNDLPWGNYQARICYDASECTGTCTGDEDNRLFSDYTCWKVINIQLKPDRANHLLHFSSANAKPLHVSFRDLAGRWKSHKELFSHHLSDDERNAGCVVIPEELTQEAYPYIHFLFSTEYGNIINKPLAWFE